MAPCLLPKISGVEVNNFGVKYAKFGVFANPVHKTFFTSQLCSGRQRSVLESVMHVRSCCFDHKTIFFLSLPSSSWSLRPRPNGELFTIRTKLILVS